MLRSVESIFQSIGELGVFALQAIRLSVRSPFELREVLNQLYEIGWKSSLLVIVAGFAVGAVLSLQTRASMAQFGATALIPQAVSFGLFKDVAPSSLGC